MGAARALRSTAQGHHAPVHRPGYSGGSVARRVQDRHLCLVRRWEAHAGQGVPELLAGPPSQCMVLRFPHPDVEGVSVGCAVVPQLPTRHGTAESTLSRWRTRHGTAATHDQRMHSVVRGGELLYVALEPLDQHCGHAWTLVRSSALCRKGEPNGIWVGCVRLTGGEVTRHVRPARV